MNDENPTTIILLSGGMNSSTVLFELVRLKQRPVIEAMVFNTETPTDEYMPAKAMAARAGVPISLWNLNLGPLLDINLEAQPEEPMPDLAEPKTETLFMLLNAAARAKQRRAQRIVTGHLESEVSWDPEELVNLFGLVADFIGVRLDIFESPFWHMSKADVFWRAKDLGVLGEITSYTNSCLEGEDETKQDSWGYGCGRCAKCEARAAAWAEYLVRLRRG
jgi:7-cyano-7-deazaguanine synthase in queuosine biosynthesis